MLNNRGYLFVAYLAVLLLNQCQSFSAKKPNFHGKILNLVGKGNPQSSQGLVAISPASSELLSKSGDNAPNVNPLLIIGTKNRPIFPGYLSSVWIKDESLIQAIMEKKDKHDGYIGVFLRKDDEEDIPEVVTDINQVHKVGGFAQIQSSSRTERGLQLIVMGHRRITLEHITSLKPVTIANVTHWKKSKTPKSPTLNEKAFKHEILSSVRDLLQHSPLLQEMVSQWISHVDFNDLGKMCDFATALLSADATDLQKVLEAREVSDRLQLVLELLTKEKELAKVQREINKNVSEKLGKAQREYFLKEQLKSIKKELNMEGDDKDDLVSKYQAKLDEFTARGLESSKVKLIADEIRKIGNIEKTSAEYSVVRNYLDWLTSMPWNLFTKDLLSLNRAKTVLDEDHYGLDDVKKRILEFIAVGKLKGSVAGKILCLVGPPGVGKTSIAKSIARSLGRKYYRFSVGGLTDTAEIKGHRRTYVGAMPGKPVQCLKTTECLNPLILIDEIDKVGRGHNGDPSSALLELLDPNQNAGFVDHYLDTSMDFSQALFVCTANDAGSIPAPLRDRMEMIRLSGYDMVEKVAIASKYLVPKCFNDAGLLSSHDASTTATGSNTAGLKVQCEITEAALEALVKNYCRESGVRSLEKMIERVARKLAYSQVSQAEESEGEGDAGGSAGAGENSDDSKDVSTQKKESVEKLSSDTLATLSKMIAAVEESSEDSHDETTHPADGENKQSKPSTAATGSPPLKVVTVTPENLEEYAGKPVFTSENMYESSTSSSDSSGNSKGQLPVGVVMGLAWDPMGGCPIFVESAATPTSYSENGGGIHTITGQLGGVMRESVSIAYNLARRFIAAQNPKSRFFNSHQLHVHVPEGAVQKDGPSAGVAMTTSLISLAMNTPVRPRLAMTGEISLTGKVLPVGGIKEKALAARRSGATAIILPAANRRDFEELPVYVKEHLEVHYASEYSDVYKLAFPAVRTAEAVATSGGGDGAAGAEGVATVPLYLPGEVTPSVERGAEQRP